MISGSAISIILKISRKGAKAGDDGKKRSMNTLGGKMRQVIEENFGEDREVDENEAEEEFIKTIKIIKGVIKEDEGEEKKEE